MDGTINQIMVMEPVQSISLSSSVTSEQSSEKSGSSDVSEQDYIEQSVEDSEGCGSNSPVMKPRSFYSSLGSSLVDVKEKHRKLLISSRVDKNEFSSTNVHKKQKLHHSASLITKTNSNSIQTTKQHIKRISRKKNPKKQFDPKVILFKNTYNVSLSENRRTTHDVNILPETVTNVTNEIGRNEEQPSPTNNNNSFQKTNGMTINSDIQTLVNQNYEKYENMDILSDEENDMGSNYTLPKVYSSTADNMTEFHLSLDVQSQSDSESNSESLSEHSLANSSKSWLISSNGEPNSSKTTIDPNKDNIHLNGDDVHDDGSDNESGSDVDSSLCAFIDTANNKTKDWNHNINNKCEKPVRKKGTRDNISDESSIFADSIKENSSKLVSEPPHNSSNLDNTESVKYEEEGCQFSVDFKSTISDSGCLKSEATYHSTTKNKNVTDKFGKSLSNKTGLFKYFQPVHDKSARPSQDNICIKRKDMTGVKRDVKSPFSKTQNQTISHHISLPLFDVKIEELTSPNSSSSILSDLKCTTSGKLQKKSKKVKRSPVNNDKKLEQLYIDVGQKNFGHTSCPTCGMLYTKTLNEDALQHAKYHEKMFQKLKFKGWKNERIVQEFHDGRIVQVNPEDSVLHQKKVSDLREVVDGELGFAYRNLEIVNKEKVFMFISNKRIVGCAIAVSIDKAYPVITTADASTPENNKSCAALSWCCSSDPVSAVCGISRIWVLKQERKKSIATRLIDAVRNNFIFGVVISKDKLAFSDPTPDGKIFAEKYSATPKILVFR